MSSIEDRIQMMITAERRQIESFREAVSKAETATEACMYSLDIERALRHIELYRWFLYGKEQS